jgi:DNA polymerase-3 subunit epsilon
MRWQKTDNDFLQTLEFVAFDTETTGLWAPSNRIVEVGAVKFRLGQTDCQRFQALVNPERSIPLETIRVHNITDSMVKSAETIKPVLEQFLEFCGADSILIAHNALFDISFIGCEMDRVGLSLPNNQILDTVDIFRKFHPGLDSYSLLSLAQQFKISRTQNHRATDDAALVWKLFLHVSQDFPSTPDSTAFKRHFTFYSVDQWQGEVRPLPEEFADIQIAIDEKTRLEIVYQSNNNPPQTRVIKPFRIHYLKSNHYITAYCERVESERTFRLDRICSFRLLR